MNKLKTVATWGGVAAALLPFLLLTAFNHPFFDDYRNAYWMRNYGVLGVQRWAYLTWTGRFTSTFLMTVFNPVAYGWLDGVKLAAGVIFLGQWACIAWFWRTLLRVVLGIACSWSAALLAGGLLLALACNAMPAPFSFLYWFAGALVYQVPHMALLLFITLALLLKEDTISWRGRAKWLAAACLVLAVTGNELLLVQGTVVLALLGRYLPKFMRRTWLAWLVLGTLAAAVAVVAPGNWVRAGIMAPEGSPVLRGLLVLPRAVLATGRLLANPVAGGGMAAALLLGLALGWRRPARLRLSKQQWWAAGLGYLALNGAGFLLFAAVLGAPLNRALNEMLLVGMVSTAGLGWLLALAFPRPSLYQNWLLPALVLVLFAGGHVRHAWVELLTTAPAYEAQMQARNRALATARTAHAASVSLPMLQLRHGRVLAPLNRCGNTTDFDIDLTPGCEGTINGVLARYYELPRVCAIDTAAP